MSALGRSRAASQMSPWPRSRGLRALLLLWSLPLGVVGLLGAALFWAFGWGTPEPRQGAIEIASRGPVSEALRRRGWAAFTLGWTIFYWSETWARDERVRRHERVHVAQGLRWGILLPVLYLACLAVVGYRRNPFEREARGREERRPPR